MLGIVVLTKKLWAGVEGSKELEMLLPFRAHPILCLKYVECFSVEDGE